MKKLLYITALVLCVSGCEKVLEIPDTSAISPEIWDNEDAATLFINKLYDASLPTFGGNSNYSDESPGGDEYMYGTLTSSSVGDYSLANYRIIRDINIAIDEALNGNMPQEGKNRILGQAYFLRAWRYWLLVRLYGGVPMALEPLNPYDDELNIPRSKTSESINIILSDLAEAIQMLPASWSSSERGRITRGAAMALKGRILLFWASPQFNPANKPDRWTLAYEANLAAKDTLLLDGYKLHDDFETLFMDEENDEVIFGRLYDYTAGKTHGWDNSCRPISVGLDGGTSNNPTWDLVQAFPMATGLSIDDPGSGYDSIYYWLNRDPRFYATVAYNGCEWDFEGFPTHRKQWQYYYYTLNKKDTIISPIESPSTSNTGFYCKKAVNSSVPAELVKQVGTDWIELRLAEVLLNLAECANEVDKSQEALNELIAIRKRAGIPSGSGGLYGLKAGMSKEELREAVLLERRIEFAFENKRYWDLRRHNLFSGKLNGTSRHGLITLLNPLPDSTFEATAEWFISVRDTINIDEDFERYFTIIAWALDQTYPINYPQPLYNFFAIPPDMLDRSPVVEQTMGWDNGTFDPLAE